ncbi:MAG: hypothetical protein ABH857_01425, partial [Elusimicrobiota bacterium]
MNKFSRISKKAKSVLKKLGTFLKAGFRVGEQRLGTFLKAGFRVGEECPHRKIISIIVLTAFLTVTCNDFAFTQMPLAAAAPANAMEFSLALTVGKVSETYSNPVSKELVLVVQDVHCNKEAQENITAILNNAKRYYGKDFKLVGIEGSTGEIDPGILRRIPHADVKDSVVNYFLNNNTITGAEAFGVYNDIKLYGIENNDLYTKDFMLLYNSLLYRDITSSLFGEMNATLNIGKNLIYPSAMKNFEKQESLYKQGGLKLEEYFSFLINHAKTIKINTEKEFPELRRMQEAVLSLKRIDLGSVRTESAYLLSRLKDALTEKEYNELTAGQNESSDAYYNALFNILESKKVRIASSYPNLDAYLSYYNTMKNIDEVKVVEEEEALRSRIKEELLKGRKDAERIRFSDEYLKILESYINNEVSSQDVEAWEEKKNEFNKTLAYLDDMLDVKDTYKKNEEVILEAQNIMDEFYSYANERNKALVNNHLKEVKKERSSVSAIVIGGHHTKGVTELLRARGVSYKVITPKIYKVEGKDAYTEGLKAQAKRMGVDTIGTDPSSMSFLDSPVSFLPRLWRDKLQQESSKEVISNVDPSGSRPQDGGVIDDSLALASKLQQANVNQDLIPQIVTTYIRLAYKEEQVKGALAVIAKNPGENMKVEYKEEKLTIGFKKNDSDEYFSQTFDVKDGKLKKAKKKARPRPSAGMETFTMTDGKQVKGIRIETSGRDNKCAFNAFGAGLMDNIKLGRVQLSDSDPLHIAFIKNFITKWNNKYYLENLDKKMQASNFAQFVSLNFDSADTDHQNIAGAALFSLFNTEEIKARLDSFIMPAVESAEDYAFAGEGYKGILQELKNRKTAQARKEYWTETGRDFYLQAISEGSFAGSYEQTLLADIFHVFLFIEGQRGAKIEGTQYGGPRILISNTSASHYTYYREEGVNSALSSKDSLDLSGGLVLDGLDDDAYFGYKQSIVEGE